MATPLDILRHSLLELNDYVSGVSGDSQGGIAHVDTRAIAIDITNLARSDLKPDELGGILRFIKLSADKNEHIPAKVEFLEFIAEQINKKIDSTAPFFADIRNTCLALFVNDQAAKVKVAALQPIKAILTSYSSTLDRDALDIRGIFDRLFSVYTTQQSKLGSTVKAVILEVLGIIAHYFSDIDIVQSRQPQLFRWYLATIQGQMKAGAKQELVLLAGALSGLDHLMFSFSDRTTKRDQQAILEEIKKIVNVPEDLSRLAAPVAALDLFANHITLFHEQLIDIYQIMYQRIANFCTHSNYMMSKCGYRSLDIFLQEMALVLKASPDGAKERNCFWFFMTNFTQMMNTESPDSSARYKAVSVAIRGYGYFAAPCKRMLSKDDLEQLLDQLLKKSTFMFTVRGDATEGATPHLSAFIQAFTYVAMEFDEIPDSLMAALTQMSSIVVVSFVKLSSFARVDCTIALNKLLMMLFRKGEGLLRGFVDKLMYKLLVFTCSDIQRAEGPTRRENVPVLKEAPFHSYALYLFLWDNLFKGSVSEFESNTRDVGLSDGELEAYTSILYGSMMQALVRMVSLLNLSVTDCSADSEDQMATQGESAPEMSQTSAMLMLANKLENPSAMAASGNLTALQANNAKDFIIFQNLTDFWRVFLPKTRPELFASWAFVVGETLIGLSTRSPLVSGFYKMFATCLQVCQQINMFSTLAIVDGTELMVETAEVDVKLAATLFRKYIAEVLARLEQYKDDLLASCLQLVLSSPPQLVSQRDVVRPIQMALRLGLSYLPLASVGLEAIERWLTIVQGKEEWFAKIAPYLNDYLMVNVQADDEADMPNDGNSTTPKRRGLKSRPLKYQRSAMVISATIGTSWEQVHSLQDLQLQIVRMLGRQAGISRSILKRDGKPDATETSELLAWDPASRVKLKVPFPEMKIELLFDEMLPRIVDLALYSLNRKIKVASCELLHSLVLLMVGSSAFRARDSQDPKKSPFHKIYLHIFPALLKLAIDVDQVPRTLYRPLVLQLIHWFTNNAQYENPETIAFLSCCMDAACDTLGPLRDFGAECLGEFVKWSIKQSSSSSSSSANVKSVLKRVYNLAGHSDTAKRLGAALIVNRIYRVFREEAPLVNQFTLELLYWLLYSLKTAESDPEGLGTRQQTRIAISHMQRIIRQKANEFNRGSDRRRPFPGLTTPSNTHDLSQLVEWLMEEVAKPEAYYAATCRELIDDFAKLLPGIGSSGAWISSKLAVDTDYLLHIFALPQQGSDGDTASEAYCMWSSRLQNTITNYSWLLGQQGISASTISHVLKAPVLQSAAIFLKRCTDDILSCDFEHRIPTSMTPTEKQKIRNQQFSTCIGIITFVVQLLNKGSSSLGKQATIEALYKGRLLDDYMMTVLAEVLFSPTHAGYDVTLESEPEKSQRLRADLKKCLETFKELPSKLVARMTSAMAKEALADDNNPVLLSMDKPGLNPVLQGIVVSGLQMLQECDILKMIFDDVGDEEQFIVSCFNKFMELNRSSSDRLWVEYWCKVLRLTLKNTNCHRRLWEYLLDGSNVQEASITYQTYATVINQEFALHFSDVAPVLIKKVSSPMFLSVWNDILDFLFSHNELRSVTASFLDQLTKDSSMLEAIVNTVGRSQSLTLITVWKRLVALSPRILRNAKSEHFIAYVYSVFQSFFERDPITREYLPLTLMTEAIPLLGIFLAHDYPHTSKLEAAVNEAIMTQFPMASTDYEKGSAKFNDYISALDVLLKAMITSANFALFKTIVIGVAIREDNHVHMSFIQKCIASYALKLPLSKFLETTGYCFSLFIERGHRMQHRRNVISQVLLPILLLAPPMYVSEFYAAHIVQIMDIVRRTGPRPATEEEKRTDLQERICCYELLQALYRRLPVEMVHSSEAKIVQKFKGSTQSDGKELTLAIVKAAHADKLKQDSNATPETAVVQAEFNRAAYNSLAAAILCTQRKEDFYRQFLFRDNPAKKEYFWENIVDTKTNYYFEQVLAGPMARAKLADLRAKSTIAERLVKPTVEYMSMKYLRDSSLSQSVGVLDESKIYSDEISEDGADKDNLLLSPPEEEPSTALKTAPPEHVLELDAINANPCMRMILLLVNELHTNITPPRPSPVKEQSAMPKWMLDLYTKFKDPATHLNVRLFIAKIIINIPEAFEMYAAIWIRSLMRLAMEGESYGEPMNYFVHDLAVLVVVWGETVTLQDNYEDRVLLSSFLGYMMKHAHHSSRQVLRSNIDLIKGIFENWSNLVVIPTPMIYDNFSKPSLEMRNATGIQLLGIVLTHDCQPFYKGPEVDLGRLTENEYYDVLARNMASKHKEVYSSCAEVCGMVLAYMKKHNCMNSTFEEAVHQRLVDQMAIGSKTATGYGPFLTSLHKVQLRYPEMTDSFGSQLLFILPQLLGDERGMAIEILAARAKQIPDLFNSLRSKDLLGYLAHKDESTQFATLSVLYGLWETLSENQILYFLDTAVFIFSSHSSLECRKLYYSLLMVLYTRHKANKNIAEPIRTQLLRGLADSSESIRRTVLEFWYGQNQLSTDTFSKLQVILSTMYDPKAEDNFLTYATYMILDGTKKSFEYNKPIFDEALPNAKFDAEYASIDTSWRHTAAMTPLFVQTQQSQSQDMTMSGKLEDDELRATVQTYEFSLTMDGGTAGLREQLGVPSTPSTFLFTQRPPSPEPPSQDPSYSEFKYRKLKYRHREVDTKRDSQLYARMHERSLQSQAIANIDREKTRAKRVTMIRKYRVGDLPDIQINYSDIIRPLQSLAEMDVEICRVLFSKLVTTLVDMVDKDAAMTEAETIEYKHNIMSRLQTILSSTTTFFTPFVGSILRIFHEYGEVDLPADLVSRASIRSSNQHLGIVLLEKQIQYPVPKERSAKRQRVGTSSSAADYEKKKNWVELAKVYKSIDETSIYKSIYESKIAFTDLTRSAITAELMGDYLRACEIYMESIQRESQDADELEIGIWEMGRLECLENLGNWEDLSANVLNDLADQPITAWDPEFQEPYLRYFLGSHLKLIDGRVDDDGMFLPWTRDDPNPAFAFIDEGMKVPARRRILESQFSIDLSVAAIQRRDLNQASHYVRQSYNHFLSKWANLPPLSVNPRLVELSRLQRVVEMEEYLQTADALQKSDQLNPFYTLLDQWHNRYPDKSTDNIATWMDVVDDRKMMIARLEELRPISSPLRQKVLAEAMRYYARLSAAAREQGNFAVSDQYVQYIKTIDKWSFDALHSDLKLNFARADAATASREKVQFLLSTLSKFDEERATLNELSVDHQAKVAFLESKTYSSLIDVLTEDADCFHLVKSNAWARSSVQPNAARSVHSLIKELQHRGLKVLQPLEKRQINEKMRKKAMLTMARYCDKLLRLHEASKDSTVSSNEQALYAELVVRNTLSAIHDDGSGATELFPRLLQIIELYPTSQQVFTSLVSAIPGSWSFAQWIPQMVAILDRSYGQCIMPILKSIAREYPNALYYPLSISSENFDFEKSSTGERRRADVNELRKMVRSTTKERFVFELRRLTNPEHIIKDWFEQTKALMGAKAKNANKLMELYKDMSRLLFGNRDRSTTDEPGRLLKAFASKHASRLNSYCGTNGEKLARMSSKEFNQTILRYVRNEILMAEPRRQDSGADLLASYSPWLAKFQTFKTDEALEIPGQYTGAVRPDKSEIATVVGFDQRVLVMSSIRKPKRVSILGSDEREHLFLVKGGEDLRLDQRIQQLFSLMNDIMRKDPQCSQQKISVRTYKVIPMTGSIGILEWVDNTRPLRSCIESESSNENWKRPQEIHSRFVESFRGDIRGYINMFMHGTRDRIVKHIGNLWTFLRDDLLRQNVARLASSPEAFLNIRYEFAKSLAAINVCSYLLGIGDRHLENFLLDLSTGCLIPIDFGHAFGSATEVLPVPELVPFRLTRQLESFLDPLGTKGLLEHPMINVMHALQSKKEILLNTMDVFVKEPLLDWRKFAINQAIEQRKRLANRAASAAASGAGDSENDQAGGGEDDDGVSEQTYEIDEESALPPKWYLEQKLHNARRKLERHNPAYITATELRNGHVNKPYLEAIVNIAKGDPEHNIRARLDPICGSVKEQVEALIDQATDPNVLGRMWVGWMSWV
ncbi:hypothetical protein BGW42_002714 [Actinomortierella wolfii]|nr:hypothetical protein BGW42_002714 [Actinomortierella wolfii]